MRESGYDRRRYLNPTRRAAVIEGADRWRQRQAEQGRCRRCGILLADVVQQLGLATCSDCSHGPERQRRRIING